MADATSDAMGVVVPLIGLGIVANMANNMTRQPATRTRTRTRTVYRNRPKYLAAKKPKKMRRKAKAPTSFFG